MISKVGKGEEREKILLNHVSADAHPGQVLAIAGPSGSSKTTFLDALAGRIDRNSLKGQILVNGRPMDSAFKRVSGYVMQVWLGYGSKFKFDAARNHKRTTECLEFQDQLNGDSCKQENQHTVLH